MLKLDWATIAFQTINFIIIAVALYYLAFRPLMSEAKKRAAERKNQKEQLHEDREEARQLRAELEERLADAEERADEIIAEAQKKAESDRQEMLENVRDEVERALAEAEDDVQQMRQQEVNAFHDELLDAIMKTSTLVIRQAAPPEIHKTMVKQLNERIWEMGRSEMERVRAFRKSLGERTPTAYVTTAESLSAEQQGELARTLTALADRNVDLQMETDPSLAAGMRVRLADIVVDNSIAGRLEELREDASRTLQEQMTNEQAE
jgi:F-type H+-transporting ATPase subunit b